MAHVVNFKTAAKSSPQQNFVFSRKLIYHLNMKILILSSLFIFSQLVSASHNVVVDYFRDAEIQMETAEQCESLKLGLQLALQLPPEKLKEKRFKNYQGEDNKWNITELIKHYVVPKQPLSLNDEEFYRDYRSKPAIVVLIQFQNKIKYCKKRSSN